MVTSPVVLGPFSGGLNKASDASAIADNEVSECVNLNIDVDGSLVCRSPISQVPYWHNTAASANPTVNFNGRVLTLGTYIIGNIPYLMMSTYMGVFAAKVTERNGVDWLDFIVVSTTTQSDCVIQLHNCVYVVSSPASGSGNSFIWDGTTVTIDTDGPKGSAGVFFKGRIWVVPGAYSSTYPAKTQLRFSDPVPLTGVPDPTWSAANNIPVGQGDGQNLIDLLIVNDNLMLFKNNSTYVYMFDVSPNEGILRKINNNIGVSAQFCALTHGNEAYVYHEGNLYQISNFNFIDTTIKIPFKHPLIDDNTRREKVSLSLIQDIILIRYFESMYVLNLVTKTWSEWTSGDSTLNSVGRFVKLETNSINNKLESYYAGSSVFSNTAIMQIKAEPTSSDSEKRISEIVVGEEGPVSVTFEEVPIQCKFTTKIYDFGTPHLFKRLMWWGVDMIGDGRIVAVAKPARQTLPTTWDILNEFSWNQLFTWDEPTEETAAVITDFNDPYVIRRKFIKLLKSLRFRRISFSVRFSSSGKTSSQQTLGPSRVFSISAIVGAKQTVVKQVE